MFLRLIEIKINFVGKYETFKTLAKSYSKEECKRNTTKETLT